MSLFTFVITFYVCSCLEWALIAQNARGNCPDYTGKLHISLELATKKMVLKARAGQTRTFLRFCILAHPTRRHFSDAMGEDATVLHGKDANAKDATRYRC